MKYIRSITAGLIAVPAAVFTGCTAKATCPAAPATFVSANVTAVNPAAEALTL